MSFDEFASRLDLVAHEDGEEAVCFDSIGELDLQHDALFRIHRGIPELFRIHFAQPFVALDRTAIAADLIEELILFIIIVGVVFLTALAHLIQRRLGDEDVTFGDERLHIAIEEGEEQCPDVRTIDIGIRHDDDLVIAKLCDVEVFTDARTESGDHGTDGIGIQDTVEAGFFYIQDLAAQREDRLIAAVTAGLRRSACRVPFDDIDLCHLRVFFCAVSQLSRKAGDFERILAPDDDFKSDDYMSLAYDTENVIKGNFKGLNKESYGRYWHGYQVTLKPLMTIMDYSAIRILNYILFSLLIVVCSWLIYRKIGKAACGLFVLSLALINFPIVPLSLQFSTCFYLSFLSMIAVMVFPRLVEKDDNLYCTFFIIGGITSFMDFLTTPQLTLGLPMIVCLLMSNRKDKWKYVIYISIAWALGYGLIWASKWLVGYLLTGTNILADAMESAKLRTSDVYKGPGADGYRQYALEPRIL